MTRLSFSIASVLLVVAALAAPATARQGAGGKVPFATDVEAALAQAAEAKRPLLVYFTHDD